MADLIEHIEGGIATLTLNRPDSLNALSDPMITALLEALDRLGRDPAVGAIVLAAAGRAFCAGGDVKAMASPDPRSPQQKLEWVRWGHLVPQALARCPKVTIASIQGAAMGAGLGMALCCDFRIVARSAKFGLAFVKIGLSTDFGVSWQLPRIVGEARARELMLTGDIFDAAAASAMGLATRLVDDDALTAETLAWARRFAAGPVLAQASIKRNLLASQSLGFEQLLEYEAVQQIHATETLDHQEAVQAFLQRRPAVFQGR
ncbi:MAG: enoyl-CoA hydratase/isomerase family protein [Hydrogenophaga sp.]|uniref:enoyl-CoA hydratase/isomerase family protein n=1 Tax=Hydrogenophaga sp. TaxID=1904254 RepID=UPI003D0CF7B0